jgi:hypothetical protein
MSGREIPKYRLERRKVMRSEKEKTASGLRKSDLMYTSERNGKVRTIVSRARHESAKSNPRLQEWLRHVGACYKSIRTSGGTYQEAMVMASKSWH